MKSSRYLNRMAKSGAARTLALVAAMLLTLEPFAFALSQIVSKYPTGNVISTVDMDSTATVQLLEKGTVFGFNSAKSAADADAFATVQEAACASPASSWDYTQGREGFTTTAATNISYGYSGVEGHNAGGALQTRLSASNTTARTYTWSRSFLWDCGTPSGAVPVSVWYRRGATWVNQGATANLSVVLVKPDLTTVPLIASTSILGAANSAWIQLSAADVSANFNQAGQYTVRLTGTLQGAGAGTNMYLFLDDFNVGLTSGYSSYTQDVEFTVRAAPYSSLGANQYLLDIRARKIAGDTEATNIQVCGDNLPTCASWTTPPGYSITNAAWTVFNTYYLTAAQYNNGNVRVRYVDTLPNGDSNRGGVDIEYQRVTVDQGTCVDQVQDMEADCGKCHNYGGDITKPWPDFGMHDKHAQTESISDCLWCHPNNGSDSAHRNGTVTIAGTKVFRAADGNLNGAPATATYDGTTKTCSNVACHKGLTTPAWNSVYGVNIERNCSRCHNSGTPGADNAANLNINVAWPSSGDGGGHTSHNAAVAFNEYSCQSNGSCHPDNRGQHSVVGDGQVVVKMAPNYSSPNSVVKYFKATATMGDGKCVNVSCHGGQVTPSFNLASTNPINLTLTNGTACIMCHVGEEATGWGTNPGNASQYNSPISGLHRGSPPISGQDHAGTLTNGCQACHTLAGLTKHFQFGGVTNLDTPAMDPVDASYFAAAIGYTAGSGTAPNYTTPPTCGVAANTCHAESLTANRAATTWKRRWSWDAYDTATPVNQCKNCHGHWGSFSTGVVQPHVLSNTDNTLRTTLMNNHSDSGVNCATMCHGQGGTNYNHGVAVGASSKDMSLNTNAGVVKTVGPPARVGCNFCHSATDGTTPDGAGGNHVFAEASWVTDTLVTGGVAPTCYNPGATASCHGNGTTEYWPNGTTSYPDREGRHDEHMAKIAARLSITLPGSDAEQKRMCQYCHPASPGAAGHADQVAPADLTAAQFNPIWDATNPPSVADAGSTYTSADGTCASIACHNDKTTTAGTYGWRDAGPSTCLMCHTPGGATNNPISGLHSTTPTISGASGLHDDSFGVGGTCVSCHTTLPTQSAGTTHINGAFLGNGTLAPDRTAMGLFATYTAVDATVNGTGTCSGAGVSGTGCHGSAAYGVGDAGTWARKWNSSYANATNGNECKNCHGGLANDWNFGSTTVNTGDTTTDHQGNYDGVGGSQMYGNHSGSTQALACNLCHVYADAPYAVGAQFTANHRTGAATINLNDRLGMTLGSNSCTLNCHTNGGSHTVDASGWGKALLTGPALSCATCHASITTHTDADGAGATYTAGTCTDCHTDHAVANRTGTNTANNIYIKTTYGASIAVPTMNKQYSSATHNGWIQLGGLATDDAGSFTDEASMCWGCHDLRGVSEWGTNTDTSTFTSTYDYGDLYTTKDTIPGTKTSNWNTGFWRSGKGRHSNSGTNPYWYKRGAIQSTHSVNFDSGTAALTTSGNSLGFGRLETKDSVANIRCSYCHDVHGTHNGVNGDLFGGAGTGTTDTPYLRGNWKANPYGEDGAPQLKMANWTAQGTSPNGYFAVPRGSASATNTGTTAVAKAGGWWIDQNSNNPNSTNNVHNTSGLCEQCHGTNKTGTWATASIGTIDWATSGIEAGNSNWISGYNGHANSVLNGPGRGAAASPESYARNIFTRTKRGTTIMSTSGSAHANVDMGIMTSTYSRGYSYRGLDGYAWSPAGIDQSTAFQTFAWGTPGVAGANRTSIWATGSQALTMSTAGTELANYDAQANYHTFTCSKCHNPHASRLPKLMITNCLDTNHNTWEDDTQTGTALPAPWTNTRHSQWASAQNCHRLDANAAKTSGQANTLGKGWNRVTPWLEFTSPNSTRTTITPP